MKSEFDERWPQTEVGAMGASKKTTLHQKFHHALGCTLSNLGCCGDLIQIGCSTADSTQNV